MASHGSIARRYELDWLRVLLFGLLVPHHAAVGFVGFGEPIYGFVNDRLATKGGLTELAIYWSHCWRLPSLFLIAGIGTWFATREGAGPTWMGGRITRLIVPALFGMLTVNVLAGWLILQITGMPRRGPDLLRAWLTLEHPPRIMHLWFLVNLALYTTILWPVFAFRDRLSRIRVAPPILLGGIALVVTATAVFFKPFAAGIVGNGYQFPWYLGIFAGGFLIGAQHAAVLDWTWRRAYWLLAAGLVFFSLEIALLAPQVVADPDFGDALAAGGWARAGLAPAFGTLTTAFTIVETLNTFAWVLAALGLASRFLRRDGPWRKSPNRAIFPVYVLHFPVVLVGLALLTRTAWPWPVELLILTLGTYAVTAALYLLALRTGPLVRLIGGRPTPPMP